MGAPRCSPARGPSFLLALMLSWLAGTRAQDMCTLPERLHYAELEESFSTKKNFAVGTTVSYICRPGYKRIHEISSVRTCGEDLEWSPIEQFCTERKCIHPGHLEHGYINVTDLSFGSKATFSCEKGFRLRGIDEISCVIKDKGVDWNGHLPLCERIPCEPPPSIANGRYTEADNYVYGTSVTYTCDDAPKGVDPFSLVGSATLFCMYDEQSNGVWSGPPPQCRVVKCDNPKVQNGKKKGGFGSSYGYMDTVMFECDPGYLLIGPEVITCGENGAWSPKPTCEKIAEDVCGAPKIKHGVVIPAKSVYEGGESVQIKCNVHCAFPDGTEEMTVTCQGHNIWSSLQNCACGSVSSGFTPVISNGRVIDGEKPFHYFVGDFIVIECDPGYTLHGEARIQYIGENQWNPGVPTCQLSVYLTVIIVGAVAVVVLLVAFCVYKKCCSQNGSYTVDESCKETCILKTNVPAEMEETTQMN